MTAADEIAEFYVHTVQVESYAGTGAYGDVYEPSVDVACFVSGRRKQVRNSEGVMVVSETTITAGPESYGVFAPGSKVTTHGSTSKVIARSLSDSGPLDLPDHVEVNLE